MARKDLRISRRSLVAFCAVRHLPHARLGVLFSNLVPRFPNRAYDYHLPALSCPAFIRIDPWMGGVEIILNGCPIAAKAASKDMFLSYQILIEDHASIVIVIQEGQQFKLGITLLFHPFLQTFHQHLHLIWFCLHFYALLCSNVQTQIIPPFSATRVWTTLNDMNQGFILACTKWATATYQIIAMHLWFVKNSPWTKFT